MNFTASHVLQGYRRHVTGSPRLRDATALPPPRGHMCQKCDEIKSRLEMARRVLLTHNFDTLTVSRVEKLIREYEERIVAIGCTKVAISS